MPAFEINPLSASLGLMAAGLVLQLIVYVTSVPGTIWNHVLAAMQVIGRALTSIGILGLCLVALSGWGLVVWFILMVLWVRAVIHFRAVQRRNLLSALTLVASKHMPLAPAAWAFAAEQGGSFARRVRQMASALEHGADLRDIPSRWQGTLPRESALAIRVGVDAGDLTGALQATAYASGFDRSMLQPVIGRFAYLGVVGFYLVTILMFLFIKIIPSYVKIFDDFGTALPESTRWLVFSANAIVSFWLLVTLVAVGLLLVAPIYTWLQWRGTLWPRIPAVRTVVNWIDMAPVLRMFALTTERNRPLSTVIRAVAEHHPKRSMRLRMWRVAFGTDDGLPWQEALVRQHFLSTEDAALLSAAQRGGNLHWALREMASDFERRAATRLQAVSQIVLPLFILPIGLIVAWVVMALFAPIVQLITGLA